MANTAWTGDQARKGYLTSGEFSSTLKDSQAFTVAADDSLGHGYDGTDTFFTEIGAAVKLHKLSGQFTTTFKTSEDVSGVDTGPRGISSDEEAATANTPWNATEADKMYLTSGQFSSTLKDSVALTGVDNNPAGITFDGTDTPWTGKEAQKQYLQSGNQTSTLKTSQAVGSVDTTPDGISWNGTDTLWTGDTDDKLYLTSGQFTSTIKTSESVNAVDTSPAGVETSDITSRLNPPVAATHIMSGAINSTGTFMVF